MARKLKQIADWINAHLADAGFRAEIVPGSCDTGRHIRGTRHRWAGARRSGNRLLVFRKADRKTAPFRTLNSNCATYARPGEFVVLDHNAAETYRCNQEVEDWLAGQLLELGRTP